MRSQPPQGKLRDVAGKKLGFHDGHAEGFLYIHGMAAAVRLNAKLMATSPVPNRGI